MRPIPAPRIGESHGLLRAISQRDRIRLEDGWPTDDDFGRVVILPGGEAGLLTEWWHADNRRSWRWSVEFSNSLD